jgi:hypothetical protein
VPWSHAAWATVQRYPVRGSGATTPPNKAMKLTKLSPAPFRGRSAGSCPRRTISDAGTASQLIAGVRQTERERSEVG